MSVITIDSSRLLTFLEELGKHRALTDEETDIVEDIVKADTNGFRWGPRLDQGLLRAAASPGGIARFARRHSITAGAAYIQLHRIRKRKGCKVTRPRRRG